MNTDKIIFDSFIVFLLNIMKEIEKNDYSFLNEFNNKIEILYNSKNYDSMNIYIEEFINKTNSETIKNICMKIINICKCLFYKITFNTTINYLHKSDTIDGKYLISIFYDDISIMKNINYLNKDSIFIEPTSSPVQIANYNYESEPKCIGKSSPVFYKSIEDNTCDRIKRIVNKYHKCIIIDKSV
jgi:hypothetical protein